jgi:hypothetical protein
VLHELAVLLSGRKRQVFLAKKGIGRGSPGLGAYTTWIKIAYKQINLPLKDDVFISYDPCSYSFF